jgi:hypothetical protein
MIDFCVLHVNVPIVLTSHGILIYWLHPSFSVFSKLDFMEFGVLMASLFYAFLFSTFEDRVVVSWYSCVGLISNQCVLNNLRVVAFGVSASCVVSLTSRCVFSAYLLVFMYIKNNFVFRENAFFVATTSLSLVVNAASCAN